MNVVQRGLARPLFLCESKKKSPDTYGVGAFLNLVR